MLPKLRQRWNRFFFEPLDTLSIAIYRVMHGLLVFLTALFVFPDRYVWYGNRGLIPFETVDAISPQPVTSLFAWVNNPEPWIAPLLILLMITGVTLTAGFLTRTSAFLAFIALMSLQHRTPMILNGADLLIRINTLFLIFSSAGASLSVDRLIRKARGRQISTKQAPWAQRLIQIQLSIVYLGTMYWKIHGMPWIDGTALYYVLSLASFQRYPGESIFISAGLSKLLTWSTLAIEFAAGSLIWIRRIRYPILGAALVLHLGIEILMNVPLFQWVMIASLVSFVDPEDLRKFRFTSRTTRARQRELQSAGISSTGFSRCR